MFIDIAREILETLSDVTFAYVFDSVAIPEAGRVKDLDIGLYLKQPLPTLAAQLDLERAIQTAFQKRGLNIPIDCVILNTAAFGLRASIFQKGRLLFARDEARLTDLIEQTTRQFLADSPVTTAYFFERVH